MRKSVHLDGLSHIHVYMYHDVRFRECKISQPISYSTFTASPDVFILSDNLHMNHTCDECLCLHYGSCVQ